MITGILFVVTMVYLLVLLVAIVIPPGWWKLPWVALVLVPGISVTWDIPVGYYHFRKLCDAEAGLKIEVISPIQAKRIRIDASYFSKWYAEELLKEFPSLEMVEAQYDQMTYATPPAYARYTRGVDGKVTSELIDKIGMAKGVTGVVEYGPTQAEYFLDFERTFPSLRTEMLRYTLRDADGLIVGRAAYVKYWIMAGGMPISLGRCGANPVTSSTALIDLVASKEQTSSGKN